MDSLNNIDSESDWDSESEDWESEDWESDSEEDPESEDEEDPEEDPESEDHVQIARSHARDTRTGSVCFDLIHQNGVWERLPIVAFIDFKDNTFSHEHVAQAVNDWVQTAKAHPYTKRNCLTCKTRARKGEVLCDGCDEIFKNAIYA